MKFYIDTANVDEIRRANDMGIIAGVTTNPSLIAKEGRDYAETLKEIATIVDGPISGEVKATTTDAEDMIAEGRAIYALDPKHMVVKIPMTAEGLKAIKVLSGEGIPTNCTLIFSANQALLAARAGATYVSPFLGRLDDIGQPGIDLIDQKLQPMVVDDFAQVNVGNHHNPHFRQIAGHFVQFNFISLPDRMRCIPGAINQNQGNTQDNDSADLCWRRSPIGGDKRTKPIHQSSQVNQETN